MVRVNTYVFFDMETTGMPKEEFNKTRITELSMVAVKRVHLLDTRPGATPRVQHKLTMCFNPRKLVCDEATRVTGLCNDLLEHEPVFDRRVFEMMNTFLNVLTKPVCLVAQNGLGFDFPILKNRLEKLQVALFDDLLCADCYHGFYDILEKNKPALANNIEKCDDMNKSESSVSSNGDKSPQSTCNTSTVGHSLKPTNDAEQSPTNIHFATDEVDFKSMQAVNETTPKQNKIKSVTHCSKVRRRMPWGSGPKPTESYKLSNIYQRVMNKPAEQAHRAENDCIFALEISASLSKQFVVWVDENHVKFSEIGPMTIGVPM